MSASVVTATGSVKRRVTCESCGHGYEYELKRKVVGTCTGYVRTRAEADRRAEEDAAMKLKNILQNGCDLVPCPKCSALTREMREVERNFGPKMFLLVAANVILALFFVTATMRTHSLKLGFYAAVAIVAVLLGIWKFSVGPVRRDVHGEPLPPNGVTPPASPKRVTPPGIQNGPPCVRCDKATVRNEPLCPHCGWQQP